MLYRKPHHSVIGLLLLLVCFAGMVPVAKAQAKDPFAHTFSIVARDPLTGEMVVAVQSHWFSVGSMVSWGRSGVGVVATQSFVNKSFGPRGLDLMEQGLTAQQALDKLISEDPGENVRQVALLDVHGNVAVHTGSKCVQYAGDIKGDNFSVQANMMSTNEVWPAMAEAFKKNSKMPLPERAISALEAAQAAGGDARGSQSAAIIVVGPQKTDPWNNHIIDLRVEDNLHPVQELKRLLKEQRAYDHMNMGDHYVELGNMKKALEEYSTAQKLQPQNLEMKFWTAVTLANDGRFDEAKTILKAVFKDGPNWKEMLRRLPAVGLLTVSDDEFQELIDL